MRNTKEMKANDYVLRISTSGCNLKCEYCRKEDFKIEPIIDSELLEIIEASSELGIKRIRWTGGEPTTKRNLKNIVASAKNYGIEEQFLSTNGTLLYKMADELYDAGISRINISLDTLDKSKFAKITSKDMLPDVLKSIDKSTEVFDLVKINTVLTKENLNETLGIVGFAEHYQERKTPLVVRFIELVKGGFDNDVSYVKEQHCSGKDVIDLVREKYGHLTKTDVKGDNPMCYYYNIDANDVIFGIVPNFSTDFACGGDKCKKIRLTPTGFISNCSIYQEFGHDLKGTDYKEKLEIIGHVIREKQERGKDIFKKLKHYQSDYQFWRFGKSRGKENG